MTVISRKDAIAQGLSKYFTGEPCKNEHIAPRYCQSGTCEMCIRTPNPNAHHNADARLKLSQERITLEKAKLAERAERTAVTKQIAATREANRIQREQRLQEATQREQRIVSQKTTIAVRRQAAAEMVTIRLGMRDRLALPDLKNGILAFAMMRLATVSLPDVVINSAPEHGYVYKFKCFPEDECDIRRLAMELEEDYARRLADDIARRKETIAANLDAEEAAEIDARWPAESAK